MDETIYKIKIADFKRDRLANAKTCSCQQESVELRELYGGSAETRIALDLQDHGLVNPMHRSLRLW